MFSFGIEHEVAFFNSSGKLADFNRTKFSDFQQIIDQLPVYPNDNLQLRIGDSGIRKKRWYIEGFERFANFEHKRLVDCIPKGIEIRTTIHNNIENTIAEITKSFNLLRNLALKFDYEPVLISFNPYSPVFSPKVSLNDYEVRYLQSHPEEQNASIYMVTYGPDINISISGMSPDEIINIGRKLTYYSPYIVPFSYSSPFTEGNLWAGLSVRTFYRTGKRPSALVFVENQEQLISSNPKLTKLARIPAEIGRIEFKAFDSCDDFSLYAGFFALLKGLILDTSLLGKATVPDAELHRFSAKYGLHCEDIFNKSQEILQAAENALGEDLDCRYLEPLKRILQTKETQADRMIQQFKQTGSIEDVLKLTYKDTTWRSILS
ncbi:glutamate-cysteine ligase family protein [Richelia intracellularis]|nr:glutamate-cysteine ligase family protein [Richelia intracellularis]HAE06643.1 glutamate--cysteine ligase [Richelia sp.]